MPQQSPSPEKKLRGIRRRMRSLQKWALRFKESFPSEAELLKNDRCYWNRKLPSHQSMVEGKQSTSQMKREVAQILLDACGNLVNAKPAWASAFRVTCLICVPDMFTSEICIYLDDNYFRSKIEEGVSSNGVKSERIFGRSLSAEWNLSLPAGLAELGIHGEFKGYDEGIYAYSGDHWMYGEVDG